MQFSTFVQVYRLPSSTDQRRSCLLMNKDKPPSGTRKMVNSSAGRSSRSPSREPSKDRHSTGRSLRRTPSPSESETTLLSDSSPTDNPWPSRRNNYPTPDYTIPTHTNTNYQSDSGITSMTALSETDKLAKILSSMMERNEADRMRDEQRREEE